MQTSKLRTAYLAMVAASALGLMLAATPAGAQGDQYQGDDQYDDQSQDQSDDAASDDASGDDVATDDTASDDTASDDTANDDTANDDTANGDSDYDQTAAVEGEEIEVIAPRPRALPSDHIGGLPSRISLSRAVSYGDLDLRTHHGADELRMRIRETARGICYELDAAFPGAPGDSVSCYRNAVQSGAAQADDAIAGARGYASNY